MVISIGGVGRNAHRVRGEEVTDIFKGVILFQAQDSGRLVYSLNIFMTLISSYCCGRMRWNHKVNYRDIKRIFQL